MSSFYFKLLISPFAPLLYLKSHLLMVTGKSQITEVNQVKEVFSVAWISSLIQFTTVEEEKTVLCFRHREKNIWQRGRRTEGMP